MASRAYAGCRCILHEGKVLIFQCEQFDIITLKEFLKEEAEAILEHCEDKPYIYSEPEEVRLL